MVNRAASDQEGLRSPSAAGPSLCLSRLRSSAATSPSTTSSCEVYCHYLDWKQDCRSHFPPPLSLS